MSEKSNMLTSDKPKELPLRVRVPCVILGGIIGGVTGFVGYNHIAHRSPKPQPATATAIITETVQPAEPLETQESFSLPDIQPVIITDSSTTEQHVAEVSKRARAELDRAEDILATTMDVSKSTVYEAVTMPMDEHEQPIDPETKKPCPPVEKIREVANKIPSLGGTAIRYFILPPHLCNNSQFGAYAQYHRRDIVTRSDNMNIIDSSVIMHEAGHLFGLPHVRRLRIEHPDLKNEEWYNIKPEDYDITNDLRNGYGQFPMQADGSIDPASGKTSVMGYHYKIDDRCLRRQTCAHVYNGPERNRLDSEKFPIRDIDPATLRETPVDLVMSPEVHNIQGIRVPVPEDHPIRHIRGCESVTHIIIGVDHLYYSTINGSPGFTTYVVAVDQDNNLIEIDAPKFEEFAYSPTVSDEFFGEKQQYIYNDSMLGISVTARLVNKQAVLRMTAFK